MNELLWEELDVVQDRYLSLLKKLEDFNSEEIPLATIDSINVFWYEQRNIVKLVFDYLFNGKDTYSFSAATFFDFDSKDQNSFFLLGDHHVFDDPIPSYLNTLNAISDDVYLRKMKAIISKTVKDNIKLIEGIPSVFILPLRYLTEILNQDYDELDNIAEKLFCNFFPDIKDIREYKKKVVSIQDLVENLDTHNSASILLFEGDNPSYTWDYRIKKFKEENGSYDMTSFTDRDVFYFAVFSYLRQALALIDMASTLGVIPFIRSFIPLHYYLLLSSVTEQNIEGASDSPRVGNNLLKTEVSYFLYQEFSKRKINCSAEELVERANNISFEKRVFADLGSSIDEQEISKVIHVVNKSLDEIEGCS